MNEQLKEVERQKNMGEGQKGRGHDTPKLRLDGVKVDGGHLKRMSKNRFEGGKR